MWVLSRTSFLTDFSKTLRLFWVFLSYCYHTAIIIHKPLLLFVQDVRQTYGAGTLRFGPSSPHVLPCFTSIQMTIRAVVFLWRWWTPRLIFLLSWTPSSSLLGVSHCNLKMYEGSRCLLQEVLRHGYCCWAHRFINLMCGWTCWIAHIVILHHHEALEGQDIGLYNVNWEEERKFGSVGLNNCNSNCESSCCNFIWSITIFSMDWEYFRILLFLNKKEN